MPTLEMQQRETQTMVSRSAVLRAFQRREPDAVRALYREYGRLAYAVAYRVLGRDELAEEAVQQTFVRAWQAADRIDVDRDPGPWLATIAKHAAIDVYRRPALRRYREERSQAGFDLAAFVVGPAPA
jgi:RNA polymerase sigma-70 factor (ECF subfamily)